MDQDMCQQCHVALSAAADAINEAIDRHPAHKTVSELQVASEALQDLHLLDTYVSLPSAKALDIRNSTKGPQPA